MPNSINFKQGEYPLKWDGVEILNVEVISKNGGTTPNQLRTFWSTKRFELAPGVDQSIHKGDLEVDVCAVHLNHEPFDFKIIVVRNESIVCGYACCMFKVVY